MRTVWIIASLVIVSLAGCASVPEDAPGTSPDPVYGTGPDGNTTIGFLHITLTATPSTTIVPSDVAIRLGIETANAVGQPLHGNVSWQIHVTGPQNKSLAGDGQQADKTMRLTERGTYTFTATATAPRFHDASATTTLVLDPLPLAAAFDLANGTRGEWFALNGTASRGYADLGHRCTWSGSQAVQIVNASACDTPARWLADGNQSIMLRVDDGHANTTFERTVAVAPLAAVAAPSAAPAWAQIVDDASETKAAPTNITHAWFASDLDKLYIGMKVDGIPHSQSTRDAVHRVTFTPSWNATLPSGQVEQFRVSATHPLNGPDGTPVATGPRYLRLEAKVAGAWQSMGDIQGAQVSTTNAIFWWPVPRSDLQAPLFDAHITDLAASANGPGTSDSAATSTGYALV